MKAKMFAVLQRSTRKPELPNAVWKQITKGQLTSTWPYAGRQYQTNGRSRRAQQMDWHRSNFALKLAPNMRLTATPHGHWPGAAMWQGSASYSPNTETVAYSDWVPILIAVLVQTTTEYLGGGRPSSLRLRQMGSGRCRPNGRMKRRPIACAPSSSAQAAQTGSGHSPQRGKAT